MKNRTLLSYVDRNLILLFAGFYTLFDVVFLLKKAYFRKQYPELETEPWWDFLLYSVLTDWLVVMTLMILIAISTKKLLSLQYSWSVIISLHIFLSIVIGIVIHIVYLFVGFLFGYIDMTTYDFDISVQSFMSVIDLNFLIYSSMVLMVYAYYYLKRVKKVEKKRSLLESQLVKAKMKILSSQLQPHFLFNTLNSIAVLTEIDPPKAKDTIADLSDFLREILYSGDKNFIPIEKELQTLKHYLNILEVRFSEDLKLESCIDEKLLKINIPAFIFQPLIENSIKYGYSYDHPELIVKYSVCKERNTIIIKVENNGAPLLQPPGTLMEKGIGLTNIKDRLQNIYGDNFVFRIRNKETINGETPGVETIIKIPHYHQTV